MPIGSRLPRSRSVWRWRPRASAPSTRRKICRSDASRRSALHQRLVENLPDIIRESVEPMEKIEGIKILHVEGLPGLSSQAGGGSSGDGGGSDGKGRDPRDGNLAEEVVSSALRYRAQAPFVDTLLGEIGMSGRDVHRTEPLQNLSKLVYSETAEDAQGQGGRQDRQAAHAQIAIDDTTPAARVMAAEAAAKPVQGVPKRDRDTDRAQRCRLCQLGCVWVRRSWIRHRGVCPRQLPRRPGRHCRHRLGFHRASGAQSGCSTAASRPARRPSALPCSAAWCWSSFWAGFSSATRRRTSISG